MVGMPYLSLGVVSFLIYRGYKKNQEYLRQQGRLPDPKPNAPKVSPRASGGGTGVPPV